MADKKEKTDAANATAEAAEEIVESQVEESDATAPGEKSTEGAEDLPELTIEGQLEEAQGKAAEYLDGWQRAVAEVSNLKKRMERDRQQVEADTRFKLAKGLLEVMDDFDLAEQNLPEALSGDDWIQGFFAIRKKLLNQMAELGMSEMNPEGEEFDPNFHEAVTSEPSDEHESGMVIGVLRKGWTINDKVVRAALVRVAQ